MEPGLWFLMLARIVLHMYIGAGLWPSRGFDAHFYLEKKAIGHVAIFGWLGEWEG